MVVLDGGEYAGEVVALVGIDGWGGAEGMGGVGDVPGDAVAVDGLGGIAPAVAVAGVVGEGPEGVGEVGGWPLEGVAGEAAGGTVEVAGELAVLVEGVVQVVAGGQADQGTVDLGEVAVDLGEAAGDMLEVVGKLAAVGPGPAGQREPVPVGLPLQAVAVLRGGASSPVRRACWLCRGWACRAVGETRYWSMSRSCCPRVGATGCSARDRDRRVTVAATGSTGVGAQVRVGLHVGGGVDVELVGLAAAGHRDVAPFAVQRVGAEHEGVVDGQPLGLVAGDRVPVGDVAGVEVPGRDVVVGAVVVDERERGVSVHGADGAPAGR